MGNRKPGAHDPGAVRGSLQEASIVLLWAHELRKACEAQGIAVWMTRHDASDPAPLSGRAGRAAKQGCTHLVSLHVNDAEAPTANGVETFFRKPGSKGFAEGLHAVLKGLGLRDRGVKNGAYAVLSGLMPSALLELGFIGSKGDMAIVTSDAVRVRICRELAAHLAGKRPPEPKDCTCR